MKICCRCKTLKDTGLFSKCAPRLDGLQPRCKQCDHELRHRLLSAGPVAKNTISEVDLRVEVESATPIKDICAKHGIKSRKTIYRLMAKYGIVPSPASREARTANWTLNRVVEPNYWYVDAEGLVMHKKTLWNHSRKNGVAEKYYADKYLYTKVWGKEKYKFVKELNAY
jgi:hypothetical protein